MHSSVATRIFGSSGNRWYSAEVINTADPNVVNYDINTVVLHKWPVFNLSSDGQVQMLNEPESALELIASSTNAQIDTEVTGWHVRGPAAPCLAKIADQSYDTAAAKLDAEISSVDLDSSATVGQLIEAKLQRLAAGLDLPPHVRRMVVDRAMGKPSSPSLNDIRKIVDKSTYVTASAFVRESPEAIRRLNRPLEYIISEFSAALLRGGKSTLVADTVAETKRIKIAVEHATAEIDRSSDPLAKSLLKNQMAKLGSLDNISTPVEGIVFDWRGSTYKFTGSFSAVNKILGVFRYGKNAQQVQIGAVL
jgi:hypothetical protein